MALLIAPSLPSLIQGGMGVGVSGWVLARAVSSLGQLGVVSGTAPDIVMARQLQLGDPGGHWSRALRAYPRPETSQRILDTFHIAGGKDPTAPFKPTPMLGPESPWSVAELTIAATFAAVYLAKEGHSNPVGINLLEKIQVAVPYVILGAMLAGVDVVLAGAGIPRQIPGLLDALAAGHPAEYRIDVTGSDAFPIRVDPSRFHGPLHRPQFLAIVSSHVLAEHLARKASGRVDGFIVEAPVAGGHNAPPRGPLQLDASGQPIYGARDTADPTKFSQLGLPFWLAGGFGHPGKLREALALGAHGIQVGTAFAFCQESGLDPALKSAILHRAHLGRIGVTTQPFASPTGFPFKIVQLEGTLADPAVHLARRRVCDIGLLREVAVGPEGALILRCPSEPSDRWVAKDGLPDACNGRLCLCNGLLAAIGLGQRRSDGSVEPPLLTAGDSLTSLRDFSPDGTPYTAADVIRVLLA